MENTLITTIAIILLLIIILPFWCPIVIGMVEEYKEAWSDFIDLFRRRK